MYFNFLSNFGLNSYELKALEALAIQPQSTPGQLCEVANIPSSKIYAALDHLCKLGFVLKVDTDPATYRLAEFRKISQHISDAEVKRLTETNQQLQNLKTYLSSKPSETTDIVWDVTWKPKRELVELLLQELIQVESSAFLYWAEPDHTDIDSLINLVQTLPKDSQQKINILLSLPTKQNLSRPQLAGHKFEIRYTYQYLGATTLLWDNKHIVQGMGNRLVPLSGIAEATSEKLYQEIYSKFEKEWFAAKPLNLRA